MEVSHLVSFSSLKNPVPSNRNMTAEMTMTMIGLRPMKRPKRSKAFSKLPLMNLFTPLRHPSLPDVFFSGFVSAMS